MVPIFPIVESDQMQPEIQTIPLGGVNCFLIHIPDGFILVDTGFMNKRADLEKALDAAGCRAGSLKLILVTHGDTDHTGNCAYLREKYGAKIAMHPADVEMAETGDMNKSRSAKPDMVSGFGKAIIFIGGLLNAINKSNPYETFTPDFTVEEGYDLSSLGFDAQVIHLPGHSKGSIGILTSSGDLLCGDVLMNMGKPRFHFLVDDKETYLASLKKMQNLGIKTVYPGHGKPFAMEQFKF